MKALERERKALEALEDLKIIGEFLLALAFGIEFWALAWILYIYM